MKKHIIFVMNQMTSGGAERVVSILCNELIIYYDITLVITFNPEIHYNLNENINIVNLNIDSHAKKTYRTSKELLELIRILKKEKPDIVISFIRNVTSILASKITKTQIIISERNNPYYDPPNKLWRILRKLIYPFADGIVLQTEAVKEFFSKKLIKKSIVIHNPLSRNIPIKDFKNGFSKKIVSVGRLSTQKDQYTLINGFIKFNKVYPEYKLLIYGEGELKEKLNNKIKSEKMEKNIFLCGITKQIYTCIEKCDIFVLTSRYEGYPNSLIEAMAMGMPVISTNCKYGPSDFIKNYDNGILINVGDDSELCEKLVEIVENNELMLNISQKSKNIRNDLDYKNTVEKWKNYIEYITSV